VSGRYRPGDRLNESKIAREFGISRIRSRSADAIAGTGLVMNHERAEWFVTRLNEEDVQRINSLRVVLEAEASSSVGSRSARKMRRDSLTS